MEILERAGNVGNGDGASLDAQHLSQTDTPVYQDGKNNEGANGLKTPNRGIIKKKNNVSGGNKGGKGVKSGKKRRKRSNKGVKKKRSGKGSVKSKPIVISPAKKILRNPMIGKIGKQFSSTYQPTNLKEKRDSIKMLTDLLKKELDSNREVIVEGRDINTGKVTRIKMSSPSKEVIVNALLIAAANGNLKAIDMVWNRVEGLPVQKLKISDGDNDSDNGEERSEKMIMLSDGRMIPIPK